MNYIFVVFEFLCECSAFSGQCMSTVNHLEFVVCVTY